MAKTRSSDESHIKLEAVIDAVAESYESGREIDSLESAALPSERKVVEALIHLNHVIYMGFYSTRELSQTNLRQHIGDHAYQAFELLVEQISRAVVYRRLRGGEPSRADVSWSERAVLDVFGRLPELRGRLSLDVKAAFDGDPAAESFEEIIFSYPALDAITAYRVAHEFYQRHVPLIPRIMSEHAHSCTGIDINPGAVIGKSLFIDHGTGVVIGETADIGDNVKLYQGVTLGALSIPQDDSGAVTREKKERPAKRHPTIEDDVTIYAGATILGGSTVIGEGSVIGGNVWLTSSVPPGSKITYAPSNGA